METETSNKRPQFGNRFLKDPADVFQHNAWDNVEWDEVQERLAEEKVAVNSATFLSKEQQEKYEKEASEYWDKFYGIHENRFFKDRHWLFTEFPELVPYDGSMIPSLLSSQTKNTTDNCTITNDLKKSEDREFFGSTLPSAGKEVDAKDRLVVLEVGCGVGNTVFPILEASVVNKLSLIVYKGKSKSKVSLFYCAQNIQQNLLGVMLQERPYFKSNPAYDEKRCKAFVWDITDETAELPFPKASLDIITLIFVLSAINPEKLPGVIKTLSSYLKPGGNIFFRDYGRYDMAELRFKPGRCLQEHFYVRGDGTRVYFFTPEELHIMFTEAGLNKVQNIVDRRLQVNRGKLLKMYRVWIQMKYRKPVTMC